MALLDMLQNRATMMKLMWVAFISSIVFIAIGFVLILQSLLG
jgi:hypothetical protein